MNECVELNTAQERQDVLSWGGGATGEQLLKG